MSSRLQPNSPLGVPFREVALLVAQLCVRGSKGHAADVAASLRRTPEQLVPVLEQARRYDLVSLSRKQVVLTPAGRKLAAAVQDRIDAAAAAGVERFRPYTDYTPRGWVPPN